MHLFGKTIGLAILLFIFSIELSNAQPSGSGQRGGGTIKGIILDAETKSPLSRANVSVLSPSDSSVVTGSTSDTKGQFEITSIRPGNYLVRINYVGYSTFFSDELTITRDNRNIDLKTIFLSQSSSQTDAIEIVAERQMMEYSHGKRVFNVDKNIASAGGTAIDILKNIPSVNVDIDGNISLRGSSNLRILLNGKPTSINPTVLMETMSAESIESIEIITNPSARYDAEGMSGIINLVLKKNREQGLNGLASINFGTLDKYSFSLNTAYQLNGLNLFANYDFGSRRNRANGNSFRVTEFQDTSTIMEQTIKRRMQGVNHGVRFGFDYQLGLLDQISMAVNYRVSDRSRIGNWMNTGFVDLAPADSILNQFQRYSKEIDKGPSYDYSMNYKHNFGSRGHDLSLDFYISRSTDEEDTDYWQMDIFPIASDRLDEISLRDDIATNMNIQSDYVLPLGDFKLEAGAKFSTQNMDGDYNHSYLIGENWTLDPNKTNHFVYDEQIFAVYSIFSGKIDKMNFSLGLRGENSDITPDLRTTNEKYNRSYFDLFPSVSLGYKFTNFDELQLNYSKRINRPRTRFLNPFVDYSDPNNLRSGNPFLNPEYVHAFELGYIKNFKVFSLTPVLFYRKTNDKFTFVTDIIAPGVFKTGFENLSEGTNYGLELNASFDFVKWMRFSTDFSYYRSEIKGSTASLELENNDYNWSMRGNANFFVTPQLSMQLIGNYSGPTTTAQGQRFETYFIDLGGRYDIWDRQASITFRVSDIFNQLSWGGTAESERFSTRYTMKRESRTAFLGFQYKINEGPKQRERRRQMQDNGGMEFDEF